MSAYRIAEAARRTGFTAAALRYYEDIGLLPPPERTSAGYRVYDNRAVERLAFVARAKRLGCSLDEIAELVEAWDGGQCGPVQQRLRAVVDARVAEVQDRITELTALTVELRRATAALDRHRPDGPCDDRCGCTTPPAGGEPSPAAATTGHRPTEPPAGAEPAPAAPTTGDGHAAVPVACTLGPDDVGQRLAEWQRVLAGVRSRQPIDEGVRLQLAPEAPVGDIARLAAAERACCPFFSFAVTVDERGPALEVRAPSGGADVVASLFGTLPPDPVEE